MPALEMSQEKGLLVRWLKAEGQFVHKGEPLMEIETDKALTEIESPDSGVLSQISAKPGEEVPVGHVIAILLTEESEESTPQPREIAAAQNPTLRKDTQSESLSKPITGTTVVDPVPTTRNPQNFKTILASPKARRLAAQARIDLSSMSGSGPDRAILTKDILTLSNAKSGDSEPNFNTIEVKGMRRIIADRLQRSAQEAPHITLSLSVDMSRAKDQIRDWNRRLDLRKIDALAVDVLRQAVHALRSPLRPLRTGKEKLTTRCGGAGRPAATERGTTT
jgi:pyruvate/2-oxoglutarate dehydrogenase complex dihydrolipoamide acyltransferase (E2) component